MKTAPALKQLVEQAGKINPEMEAEYGDRDGLGFARSVTFDPTTSRRLSKILKVVNDPRIADSRLGGKPRRLTVTVVADVRADFRHPYPLEAVGDVLFK